MRQAIGLSGYRGKSAIGVSGKLPIGAIGENFQSGYRGKLPIGMWQALSGKTPNRELTDSLIFLQRLGKWQEGAMTQIGNFPDREASTINPDWEYFLIGNQTRAAKIQIA